MPRASNVDWDQVKLLFMEGLGYTDIALEMGIPINTLKGRIQRENWVVKRAQHQALAAKAVRTAATKNLKELAKELKERLSADAERTLAALETRDPIDMDLDELEKRERIASALQKRTWSTFGLDVSVGDQIVNVAFMSALAETVLKPDEPQALTEETPIDVKHNGSCANISDGDA
jgi:autotransporter translocation and assembly factor TamB